MNPVDILHTGLKVSTQGYIVARYSYSPYGTLTCGPNTPPNTQPNQPLCHPTPPTPPAACPPASSHSPVGPPPCLSRAIEANHFLYDGQYLDTTSGLYYLRARWYDPANGQFTSVDAFVTITGEPCSYASGNPINARDVSGLAWATLFTWHLNAQQVVTLLTILAKLSNGASSVAEVLSIISSATLPSDVSAVLFALTLGSTAISAEASNLFGQVWNALMVSMIANLFYGSAGGVNISLKVGFPGPWWTNLFTVPLFVLTVTPVLPNSSAVAFVLSNRSYRKCRSLQHSAATGMSNRII